MKLSLVYSYAQRVKRIIGYGNVIGLTVFYTCIQITG